MLPDLGEEVVSEVVLDPELALVLEGATACLCGRVDSPSVQSVQFLDEIVSDEGGNGSFAYGPRGLGPQRDYFSFVFGLEAGIVHRLLGHPLIKSRFVLATSELSLLVG